MKTFVLSDESLNSYGLIIRTDGINLERFKRNPVMFYNHQRELGVIGRWENVRIEDGRLLADPVFDDLDELGKKIGNKVETGFLRSASIGVEGMQGKSTKEGRMITSCAMIECSVCDIPANSNAIALYDDDKRITDVEEFIKLTFNVNLNNSSNMNEFLKKVVQILKIEDPTEEKVLEAIRKLLEQKDAGKLQHKLDEALQLNLIDRDMYQVLAKTGMMAPDNALTILRKLQAEKYKANKERIERYFVDNWEKFKMYTQTDRDNMKKVAELDFELFSKITSLLEPPIRPMDLINRGKGMELKNNWTLDDYRKNNPEELKRNPDLYQKLIKDDEKEKRN